MGYINDEGVTILPDFNICCSVHAKLKQTMWDWNTVSPPNLKFFKRKKKNYMHYKYFFTATYFHTNFFIITGGVCRYGTLIVMIAPMAMATELLKEGSCPCPTCCCQCAMTCDLWSLLLITIWCVLQPQFMQTDEYVQALNKFLQYFNTLFISLIFFKQYWIGHYIKEHAKRYYTMEAQSY